MVMPSPVCRSTGGVVVEVTPHFSVTCPTMALMVTMATLALGGAVVVVVVGVGGVETGDGDAQRTMGVTVVEHPPR